ncbi:MAG: hypothetical protein SPI28_09665 [Acetatifactor sp.]|nr:hypothetical protein [Acetatifactor sp.]
MSFLVLAAYGVACFYLHYMQSIQPAEYENRYFQSDLPYHISMIIEDGWYYSFTAYVYQILYVLGGNSGVLIAVFLTGMSVGTVLLTKKLLALEDGPKEKELSLTVQALMCNLVMAFFLPLAGKYRYVSYQNGNLWHNSTYLVMRLIGMATLLYYFRLEKTYGERISAKNWFILTALLAVGTGVKPSFLTVFAPALALKLLWDLFHRVRFRQIFLLGCTVLPSLGVMLWQNAVLFGQDTGNGFHFAPWYTFSLHADRPKVAVLCSLAFPLVVVLFSLKKIFSDKQYFFAWMMTGIGFFEALLLAETGSRSRDGNFLWGYLFALFFLYVYSFRVFKEMLLTRREEKDTKVVSWIPVALCGLVFLYQLYCGVYFFLRLLGGETYFMFG